MAHYYIITYCKQEHYTRKQSENKFFFINMLLENVSFKHYGCSLAVYCIRNNLPLTVRNLQVVKRYSVRLNKCYMPSNRIGVRVYGSYFALHETHVSITF